MKNKISNSIVRQSKSRFKYLFLEGLQLCWGKMSESRSAVVSDLPRNKLNVYDRKTRGKRPNIPAATWTAKTECRACCVGTPI